MRRDIHSEGRKRNTLGRKTKNIRTIYLENWGESTFNVKQNHDIHASK